LVPSNDDLATAGLIHQHWRRAEVEVRRVAVRTHRGVSIGPAAVGIPDVVLGHLARPEDLSGIQIERNDGIGLLRRWDGIIIASSDIERVPLRINGWRNPHRNSRWSPKLQPGLVLSGRPRLLRDGVCLPELFAGRRIKRDNAAAKLAAGILITDLRFL